MSFPWYFKRGKKQGLGREAPPSANIIQAPIQVEKVE